MEKFTNIPQIQNTQKLKIDRNSLSMVFPERGFGVRQPGILNASIS
jgi:hypothetical protein